jgi:hypothetical protein
MNSVERLFDSLVDLALSFQIHTFCTMSIMHIEHNALQAELFRRLSSDIGFDKHTLLREDTGTKNEANA